MNNYLPNIPFIVGAIVVYNGFFCWNEITFLDNSKKLNLQLFSGTVFDPYQVTDDTLLYLSTKTKIECKFWLKIYLWPFDEKLCRIFFLIMTSIKLDLNGHDLKHKLKSFNAIRLKQIEVNVITLITKWSCCTLVQRW